MSGNKSVESCINPNNREFWDRIRNNLPKFKEVILDPRVHVYFCPSAKLRELVVKDDSRVSGLPQVRKQMIIRGTAFLIAKSLVTRFVAGTLDEKNSFILNNGEIRICDDNIPLLNVIDKGGK